MMAVAAAAVNDKEGLNIKFVESKATETIRMRIMMMIIISFKSRGGFSWNPSEGGWRGVGWLYRTVTKRLCRSL